LWVISYAKLWKQEGVVAVLCVLQRGETSLIYAQRGGEHAAIKDEEEEPGDETNRQ
jgi:hypothetical protein